MKIYIKIRDRAYGPLEDDKIEKMIASGKLKPQSEISFDRRNWFPAGNSKDLFPVERNTDPYLTLDDNDTVYPSRPQESTSFRKDHQKQKEQSFGDLPDPLDFSSSFPAEMDQCQWFLSNDGQTGTGPYRTSDILQFLKEQKAFPQSLIWQQGSNAVRLCDQAEFRSLFGNHPFETPLAFSGDQGIQNSPSEFQDPSFPGSEPKTFLNFLIDPLFHHYCDFTGRSTRKEFWIFHLLLFSFFCLLSFPIPLFGKQEDPHSFFAFIFILYSLMYFCLVLAVLLPALSIQVRRFHDTGFSGWLILIGLVPVFGNLAIFIMDLLPGTEGANIYGADPRIRS